MNYSRLLILVCLLGTQAIHAEDWWVECEYLLWTTKKAPLPVPLVTSASLDDPLPGALGQPGTHILMGDEEIDMGWQNGFRIALGNQFDSCHQLGIEGSFFMLPSKRHQQTIQTSGEPGSLDVAVPIFDVTGLWGLDGVPGETVFILPGPQFGPGFQGTFSLKMTNQLMGSELNALANMISHCGFRMDCLGGFRWLQLKESLVFMGETAADPDAPFTGFYNFKDNFRTNNNFYGPQIGFKANYHVDRWLFQGFAKAALGCMNQQVKIHGKSQTSDGNLFYLTKNTANEVLSGGLFSEPTNQGSHHQNKCAVVLETGANVSYQFTNCFEMGMGYNFLWMNQLFRPGKLIDRKINPTRTMLAQASRDSAGVGPDTPVPFGVPAAAPLSMGPERPKFKRRSTDFWAQGLTVSLKMMF